MPLFTDQVHSLITIHLQFFHLFEKIWYEQAPNYIPVFRHNEY